MRRSLAGIVYLLTNPAMPGLVKIGKTTRDDPKVRMSELYSTGVPVPFECVKAVKVEDEAAIESALHTAFGPSRVNSQREFFEIDAVQASVLLDQLGTEDVTPQINAENETIDKQSRDAAKRLISRRPNLNFDEMSIPPGSILQSTNTEDTVEVSGPKKVIFRGTEMSLTRATRDLLGLSYSVQPTPHWRFNGELLQDIYNRTYVELDE
ncbi:GIY-YIG nuclease family protein [Roseobacter sp. HKCCD7870]|uniref:GIY-YIG nuclease family protein n=1 Tax=Roseobacter sp. HKCCD7870 TaxID=3120343 RepID=UPI0030EF6520